MRKMKKKLTTLIVSSMAMAMVFGTGITAYAAGDQYEEVIPTGVTPGGVIVYGCYEEHHDFDFNTYTTDFPVEYLLAIDAAGITNEMSDYEKCVRVNDYLCAIAEYGYPGTSPLDSLGGLDLFQYGVGVCYHYADAFQTMTSMLGIESYVYSSYMLGHDWNAVVIDGVTYFVDVTWNDNLHSNSYLMSTELWDNHIASDITIIGTSYGEEEKRNLELRAEWDREEQRIIEEFMNDPYKFFNLSIDY